MEAWKDWKQIPVREWPENNSIDRILKVKNLGVRV